MDISENARRVLRAADRRLRAIRRGDRPSVYRICRITMASLAPVDAFYIALIRADQMTVFPYTFDRGEYIEPDVLPYRPGGITHWILASQRTYRWSDDDGALLNRGVPFGAEADVSRDALITPMTDPATGTVIGLMSVQSYSPAVFTSEHQVAFEWLSQAAMLTINRDEQDRDHAALIYPELDTTAITGLTDLADHIWNRLGILQAGIEQLAGHQAIAGDAELRSMTANLGALCEDLQIETAAAIAGDEVPADGGLPLPPLTPREDEIVQLIADDRTNQEIAAELHLSEKTVKTHVTNILRKFNATQRSAVAWQVRTTGGRRT